MYVTLAPTVDEVVNRARFGLQPMISQILGALWLFTLFLATRTNRSVCLGMAWAVVWLSGAIIDVVLPLKFWPHYFNVVAPPLCILGGFCTTRIGRGKWAQFAAAILMLLLPVRNLVIDRTQLIRDHEHDIPRQVADRILNEGGASEGLYVHDYEPIIYYFVKAKPPTRFVLPIELSTFSLSSGANGPEEVGRILAGFPKFIVFARASPNRAPTVFSEMLDGALTGYEIVMDFGVSHGMSVILYRRRV